MSRRRNKPSKPPSPASAKTPARKTVTTVEQQSFSGPLPRPSILAEYNNIVPNAAERILSMAEQDADHVRSMEIGAMEAARNDKRRGQSCGVLVTLSALVAAVICAIAGAETAASIIGGTTVVGLATVFVVGKYKPN